MRILWIAYITFCIKYILIGYCTLQDTCDKNIKCFNKIAKKYSHLSIYNLTKSNTKCYPWWSHEMETFSTILALCEWNPPVTGAFPSQSPVTWSFDVLFDLRLNKRFSKQSRHWWFEMPSCSLWCHCNDIYIYLAIKRFHGHSYLWR